MYFSKLTSLWFHIPSVSEVGSISSQPMSLACNLGK